MTERDNGGPAFPWGEGGQILGGMTLRDYFAAAALQGLYANSYSDGRNQPLSETTGAELATMAYATADAMLEARK